MCDEEYKRGRNNSSTGDSSAGCRNGGPNNEELRNDALINSQYREEQVDNIGQFRNGQFIRNGERYNPGDVIESQPTSSYV